MQLQYNDFDKFTLLQSAPPLQQALQMPFELRSTFSVSDTIKKKWKEKQQQKKNSHKKSHQKQSHTCMKLNFANDSFYQAQTNGIPSQKKISSCKEEQSSCFYQSKLNRTMNSEMVILSTFPKQLAKASVY